MSQRVLIITKTSLDHRKAIINHIQYKNDQGQKWKPLNNITDMNVEIHVNKNYVVNIGKCGQQKMNKYAISI